MKERKGEKEKRRGRGRGDYSASCCVSTPDVRLRGDAGHLDDLRGHPVRRPEAVVGVLAGELRNGNAKVSDFHRAIFSNKNVCCFDVAMDNTLAVKIVKAIENLIDVLCNERLGKTSKFLNHWE